jgi:hypothetical protein
MDRFSETEGGGWIKGPAMQSKEGEEISHLSLSSEPSCSCFFSLLLLYSCSGVSASVCSGFSSLGYRMASHARFPFPRLDGASHGFPAPAAPVARSPARVPERAARGARASVSPLTGQFPGLEEGLWPRRRLPRCVT